MPNVMTEDGRTVNISITKSAEAVKTTPLDIDSRFRDPAAESRGRPAARVGQKEQRAILYRGATASYVPISQVPFMLKEGFTAEPTAPTPALNFVCDVELFDGTCCTKALRTDRDRINHIRTAHGDIAPWILSDIDMSRARGRVSANQRVAGGDDPRVAVLEAQVAELISLIKKSGSPVADTIAQDFSAEVAAANPEVEEFLNEFEEEQVVLGTTSDVDLVLPTSAVRHTCKAKGRFGKYTDGCPACDERKLQRMNQNGD